MSQRLVVELTSEDQDARDLYGERDLACAACGCTNMQACVGGCSWVIPGLCSRCAPRVKSVTVLVQQQPVPTQSRMFEPSPMRD